MDYNLPKSNNNNNNNFVQLYIFYNMFSQQKNLHSSNFIQIFQLYVSSVPFKSFFSHHVPIFPEGRTALYDL